MKAGIERTLFIELLGGVGDLLIALPAMHAIGRSHPLARHDVLTFRRGAALLAADPYVDRVHVAERGRALLSVARLLAAEHYDLVVSDTCYEGIDRLVEAHGAARHVADLWRSPPDDVPVGSRFMQLLAADGVIDDPDADDGRVYLTAAERTAAARINSGRGPLVALVVGTGTPIKRWAPERFTALGRELCRRYRSRLLVVGGDGPAEAAAIAAAVGPAARVAPRASLRQLAAALTQADLAIGADTGLCRLAAAVGTPTVMLFGPSWHGRYGLPSPHANLQGHPACPERRAENFTEQRCWYTGHCPVKPAGTCLDDLSVAEVLRAAARFLEGSASSMPRSAASPLSAHERVEQPDRLRAAVLSPHAPHERVRRLLYKLGSSRRGRAARDDDWLRARRLLVIRADNIGDVIMAGPALRALKQALPDAGLTLLASPAGAQAAPLLPWLDGSVAWRVLWQDIHRKTADPSAERRLIAALEAARFDGAIILTSFSQTPHPAAVAAWLAGIPLRAGASKEQGALLTHALPSGDDARHQVDRNLDLVRALGFPVRDDALELHVPDGARCGAHALLGAHGLALDQPFLLLNPWTSTAARTYDAGRMARAAKLISAAAHLPIVVTAHSRDAARTAALVECIGPAAMNLCGETSVSELAALVARARLVLVNNTSVMHMADALGTPAVVLFSGTDLESQWAPRRIPHRLLRRPARCSPCYAFDCPLDHRCLDIEPAEVADAALALLSATEPHA